MPEEDRKWLEEALKSYTFNDTDRLQELAKELPNKKHSKQALLNMLEELQELVEMHPRNNLNLCLSGGMHDVLALIFSHPDDDVRFSACCVFTAVTQNNI